MPLVLVAEDDVEMRRVLVDALGARGYDVQAVPDGAALLLALANPGSCHYTNVDLVLADMRMPICSGLDALEAVRAAGITVPFMFLTAFAAAGMRERATQLDALVIEKPVAMHELARSIASRLTQPPTPRRASKR